jgi:aminoglycoside phosphotransferase family enzyme/predicted kinase
MSNISTRDVRFAAQHSHVCQTSLPPELQGLLDTAAYPHPVESIELKETHISWIILTGAYAYKIKKPVQFGFIDTAELERRHKLCDEELRLNRRLAPSLYLDVVPITQTGHRLMIGGAGTVIEYAVRMKQFPESDELTSLLEHNAVRLRDLHELAGRIAHYHLGATQIRTRTNEPEQLQDAILANLDELTAQLENTAAFETLKRLRHWTHATMEELAAEFSKRSASGCIRACHGDLHAANIVRIDGRLVPFDCLEFDPALRAIDVMNDVAFLVMDLKSHGRADLAAVFLTRYLEVTGDYEGLRVLPFYAVYRALVRAKVDALSAGMDPARDTEYVNRRERRLAAASEWTRARKGALVIMHGVSGSGKSWLSEQLIARLPAIRIRSDIERKRINLPHATASSDLYSRLSTHRTYGRLLDCAEFGLNAGFNIVVDATFLEHTDRELFRTLAEAIGSSFTIVSCHADQATLRQRIANRRTEALDPSDADLDVLEAQLLSAKPLSAAERQYCVELETSDPALVEDACNRIAAQVAR